MAKSARPAKAGGTRGKPKATAKPAGGAAARAPRPAAKTISARAAGSGPKGRFDAQVLAAIQRRLIERREELVEELRELEEAAFNLSQSEMSGEVSYDEDYADAGSFTFEREKDLSIANNVQDLLDKIDRALEKIEEGTYGVCESCGQPIDSARLRALPNASLCIRCKKAEEWR
ncbi:MAG: TraR/DksA family transcriptional regulator [bacterium]